MFEEVAEQLVGDRGNALKCMRRSRKGIASREKNAAQTAEGNSQTGEIALEG